MMDLRKNFDDDIYSSITHSCRYFEPDELHDKLLATNNDTLSYYSHNIRSLPGHWNDLRELLSSLHENCNFKFSIIALQEIWNVPTNVSYNLPGYHDLCYKIRDKTGLNSNAGGGVSLWIDSNYEFEIVEELSIFEPHIYESIFVKIKVPGKKDTIFGNIYRPNTAPQADLTRAIEIHNSIIHKKILKYF